MLMSINHKNVLSEFPFYNLDNQELNITRLLNIYWVINY